MDTHLVTLATYWTVMPAETAKWALGEQGIESYIADDNIVLADWFLGNAVGGVKLMVADRDAERALTFLQANPRLLGAPVPPSKDDSLCCLRCGQPMAEEDENCTACGWSFASDGEDETTPA
ncbi:MAG: DUF2007 domain-containing protein [Planctomycetia bacterium]|nr:DUF2007 domain-containing protein [Planctomycetia bacterium]